MALDNSRRLLLGFALVLLDLQFFCAHPLSAQESFSIVYTEAGSDSLWDIVEGHAGMISVGTNGAILHSEEGQVWRRISSGTSSWLVAVAYADEKYIAVGDNGTVLVSRDAIHWTVVANSQTNNRLNNIAYGQGKWVAVGENGTIIVSENGEDWTNVSVGSSGWLRGLAFNSGDESSSVPAIWLITGVSGNLFVSEDAIEWSTIITRKTTPRSAFFDSESVVGIPSRSFRFDAANYSNNFYSFVEVGEDGISASLEIYSARNPPTSNTPRSWEISRPPDFFRRVSSESITWRTTTRAADTLVLAGTNGSIAVTDIWGTEFTILPQTSSANLNGSGFAHDSLFIVGDDLTILRSEAIYRSRLTNISTRGSVRSDTRQLIAGTVVVGPAQKSLLIRAAGPALANFGVLNPQADPRLRLLNSQPTALSENDDWSNGLTDDRIEKFTEQTGAFTFANDSKDSALTIDVGAGVFTAIVSGADTAGLSLVEFYDASSADSANVARITNLSTRAWVGTDDEVFIAGFSISGQSPLPVLLRGVGPTLSSFGVDAPIADPVLKLFNEAGTVLATNDNWSERNDSDLHAVNEVDRIIVRSAGVGAFPFENGSADSAIMTVLKPGSYTVHLSGVTGGSGEALVEIYELR